MSNFFGGKPGQIIDRWQRGHFTLCVTEEIVCEYAGVLARFPDLAERADDLLFMLRRLENVIWVEAPGRLHLISSDPSDNKFLECALAAGADLIVSGDRHLLALGEFRGLPILDPAQALPLLTAGENPSPVE